MLFRSGNLVKAIKLEPGYSFSHYCLGKLYLEQRMYDESIKRFQKAIDLDPEDVYTLNGLADVERIQGKYRDAILHYQKSLEVLEIDEHALYYKAVCHKALEEDHLARACLERILEEGDEEWDEDAEELLKQLKKKK